MTSMKQANASSLDNYKPLLDERAELHRSKKRIEDRIKELDEALRPALVGRGELIYNGFAFKVEQVAGRTTLNKKALTDFLGALGHDIAEFESVGKPSSRFTIKQVEEL